MSNLEVEIQKLAHDYNVIEYRESFVLQAMKICNDYVAGENAILQIRLIVTEQRIKELENLLAAD